MPIRMAEMLSTLDGCVYAERVCVADMANLNKAKKAIKKAFAAADGRTRASPSWKFCPPAPPTGV